MVSSGWWFLAAMIAAYGIANLLQSIAATRTATTDTLDPGLLLRLFGHRTYLLGLGCQVLGFFLALAARRDLPLFLVQSAVTAGLCVTALLGVVLLKWRLPMAEVWLLLGVVVGIAALAASAKPGHAEPLDSKGVAALVIALVVIAGLSVFAGRVKGVLGSVVLGSIAGLCFSSAAIAARPLAAAHSITEFVMNPLLYLVIAHSLMGQLLLGLAMQRGSTNAAVAGMDAAGAVPAAAIGLLLLGDQIRPGMFWLASLGFIVTLGAVIALTRFAEPQHDLVGEPTPIPVRRTSASVPGLPPHPARGVCHVPGASTPSPRDDVTEPVLVGSNTDEPLVADPAAVEPVFAELAVVQPDAEPPAVEPAFAEPAFDEAAEVEPVFNEPVFAEPVQVAAPAMREPVAPHVPLPSPAPAHVPALSNGFAPHQHGPTPHLTNGVTHGAGTNGTVAHGTVTHGANTNGAVAHGAGTNGAVASGAVANGAVSNGTANNEVVPGSHMPAGAPAV